MFVKIILNILTLVQGRKMTAVIFSFWLRVRNHCIYDRGKKL